MSRRRIAVVSSCALPRPGRPVTGGGLRTLQLVETVRAAGHVPSLLVERGADPKGFELADLPERLAKLRPSAVIVEQWALAAGLGDFDKPVAIDLHGSLLLENVYRRGEVDLALDAGAKLRALARADLLLVPSVAQLSWFASWATLAGLDPRELPLRLLPLALPGTPTKRTAKKPALRLVYGGARWPWIDSRDALLAAADAVAAIPGATLDVFAYDPPRHGLDFDDELGTWGEVDEALAGREADGVTLRPGTSHAKFTAFLREEATVALDLWRPNPERLLAATTRTVESLHAGLPVITVREASWAPALLAAGAGWTTDSGGLRALLKSLAKGGSLAKASAAATTLATTHHTIEPAGVALVAWLESPSRAVRAIPLLDRLVELERQHNALAVAALEADHRALIDKQVAAQQVEIEDLKRQAAADMEAQSAGHRAMVHQITEGHRDETAKILTDSQRQTRERVEHWQGELDRLRATGEAEVQGQAQRHAAELRAALQEQRVERDAERTTLRAERDEERGRQGAEHERERERQKGEIEALQARHDLEREQQAADLQAREAQKREEIAALVAEQATREAALVVDHRGQMAEARAEREAEVQQIVGHWQAELARADAQRTAEMEAADEQSRGEIAGAVADWEAKLDAAHERLRSSKAKHAEEIARVKVEAGAARAEAEAARVEAAAPEYGRTRARLRGPNLPGRSGQALRLARLWVEHALDRDA